MLTSPARNFTSTLFPYTPQFTTVQVAGQSVEMSYIDEGQHTDDVVVLLHGNPTWSFLYRNVIPEIHPYCRVIAPDFLGFGRSDRLPSFNDYTLDNHLSALTQLIEHLNLKNITLVVHDWGGPIGLSYAVDHPDRIARLVIMNTWAFAPKAHNKVPQPLKTFRKRPHGEVLVLGLNAFVNVALPFGVVARRKHMTREVMEAYRKPASTWRDRWPILAFPRHIPLADTDDAYERMKSTDEGLRTLKQPVLLIWGKRDPVFPVRVIKKFKERLENIQDEIVFPKASHFLQEDCGPEIGEAIIRFVQQPDQ